MALEKIPLLLVVAIFHYIVVTSPNSAPPPEEMSKYPPGDRLSGGITFSLWAVLKALILSSIFCEIAVIIATHYTTGVFSEITIAALVRKASFHGPAITPIFLVGFLLTLCGGYVRWSCYRALGPLFTFEVSIREQHKLITTGPYSIVRHPAYIGSLCAYTGILLCTFGPGSWIFECGWLDLLPVKIFAVFATLFKAGVLSLLLGRMGTEDKMMQKEFGPQWDQWAKNVPYKLVPGIL
ncbi:hypothetical protein BT96DRAFT_720202 [Gymnopus androsaceus JB14]|uniref:Protein-S-isoprenylcysteine O-methyltransferase n=1 Tax=Gymnopus androsaceus JB14 TaxID=1447944 RepID=A0A6A4HIW3_9AGAR|nr:hypothetical protein BT96DRAFT_720202 [Gymnopus androsaceus JB14]